MTPFKSMVCAESYMFMVHIKMTGLFNFQFGCYLMGTNTSNTETITDECVIYVNCRRCFNF